MRRGGWLPKTSIHLNQLLGVTTLSLDSTWILEAVRVERLTVAREFVDGA